MPLYDYKCSKCGHIFEVQQSITEEPLKFCPKCKGPIKRLISAAGIIFKGSGFHVNDYGKKPCLPMPTGRQAAGREVKEEKSKQEGKPKKEEKQKQEEKPKQEEKKDSLPSS